MSERKGRQPAKATEIAVEGLSEEVKEDSTNEELAAFIREQVSQAVQPLHDRVADLEQQVQDLNLLSMQPEGAVTFHQPGFALDEKETPWYEPPGGV